MKDSTQDELKQAIDASVDAFIEVLEKLPLPKDEPTKVQVCKIIEHKYSAKVFKLVEAGLLPDKDLKRLSIALQSITIIYKQILSGGSRHECDIG